MREHIAKVRGYGRKAALETQNHTVLLVAIVSIKHERKELHRTNHILMKSVRLTVGQKARVLVGIFKIKPSKFICAVSLKIVFVL